MARFRIACICTAKWRVGKLASSGGNMPSLSSRCCGGPPQRWQLIHAPDIWQTSIATCSLADSPVEQSYCTHSVPCRFLHPKTIVPRKIVAIHLACKTVHTTDSLQCGPQTNIWLCHQCATTKLFDFLYQSYWHQPKANCLLQQLNRLSCKANRSIR